jgi:hypothetical protein
MTSNNALKKQIRARMAETGEPYTAARSALLTAERPAIDPQLLAPYPYELIRPATAGDNWKPPTTEELGWRALPADATPQQRATAESYWRPVNPDLPCRCSGPCAHGTECEYAPDCPGRLWHSDRRAYLSSSPDLLMWHDLYICSGDCGDDLEDVAITTVPWGRRVAGELRLFPGIRRADVLPAEWQCTECGAANQYYCGCRDMNDPDECEECGATGPYACGCNED